MVAFFTPTDRFNERYEELNNHPDWSFYGQDYPSNAELLTRITLDENSKLPEPKDAREVTMEAMVVSALNSAELAQKCSGTPSPSARRSSGP